MTTETPKKTSGDLFLEQGALFGKMIGTAEYAHDRPSKALALTLAADILALAKAVGLEHLLTRKDAPK